jgi:hypothetical protein
LTQLRANLQLPLELKASKKEEYIFVDSFRLSVLNYYSSGCGAIYYTPNVTATARVTLLQGCGVHLRELPNT